VCKRTHYVNINAEENNKNNKKKQKQKQKHNTTVGELNRRVLHKIHAS
jgi:hypothetical protein